MDWAVYTIDFTQEGRRKVNLFSYVLGYSRRQYLHFTASQDMESTIREHVRAFEHLQGVAATCLYDNMKVVVARHEGDEPVYNTRFLAFATHYGFRPAACRPRRPQTKGKVERPFYFVETNLLSGREFRSLEHLNEVTAWWLAEVADVRVHRQTRRRPVHMHAEELPHLIPLPERPYEVAEVVYRTVDVEGFISYAQNRYSVPWHYIGQVLSVRITEEEVTVYDPRLEVLARHRRFPADGKTPPGGLVAQFLLLPMILKNPRSHLPDLRCRNTFQSQETMPYYEVAKNHLPRWRLPLVSLTSKSGLGRCFPVAIVRSRRKEATRSRDLPLRYRSSSG